MKQKLLMLDDLFTTQEERDEMKLEKIRDIQIKDIEDFPNHPFKINNGEEIENMKESIRQNGILVPALVRPKEDGKYEMIAGHRRKIARLKEEDDSSTNDYYSQEYEIVNDNEEMTITMICNHNALEYNFSWIKYGESVNFEYTEQEVERVTKILNSISKKKFSSEEIYEFINAEESKYSVERYGFTKYYAVVDKIKYLNDFTKDAAFDHSIWNTDNGYSSLFSINGKFVKELDNK